jgi:cytochrome subunit of sulfide dehydrogenase
MRLTNRHSLTVCLFAVVALLAATCPALAGKKVGEKASSQAGPRGQMLALSCSGCHGPDGKSDGVIPSIYGKSSEYLETALREFKSGARTSTVMGRHAKGYTDEEIHLIAEYFGHLGKKNR